MDFYLDHDVGLGVARALQSMGHGVETTRQRGLERARDFIQLLTAAQSNQVLVSHNRKDFRLMHGAWLTWSQAWRVRATHAGILILAQGEPTDSARWIGEFGTSHPVSLSNQMYECNARGVWSQTFPVA